ncbi:MAG: NifB/NifX family molybdenum-iron cluster-binding protein [Chloroflexota bacterium]
MKIAAVTDDEVNISQHFGRAPYYVVLTVEDGSIVDRETRTKAGHHTFSAHEPGKLAPGERHGYDAGSQARHASMAETIADCQVVLAGGMGWGAYESLKGLGAEVIVTDVESIYEAALKYLKGKLSNLMERLH